MILWDVDTQVDFMLPHGKLYVPGAEQTVEAMQKLVAAARAADVVHVASADDHESSWGCEWSSNPPMTARARHIRVAFRRSSR